MANNQENKTIDQEALEKELNEVVEQQEEKSIEMDSKLSGLLKKEISDYKKRNKTRAADMISIFAAHNFYANGFTPVELRTTLEDLGPTYVKIGQIMSSRVDLLPEAYCKELEKLRQNVKPLDPEVAKAVIEQETGKSIDEIYSEFRDEPLGSASMGQVHYAVLKDGTPVVTKVQRPLIADMMHEDYKLLKKLAGLVNVVVDSEDDQMIDLVSVIEELEKVTDEELDCRIEANNTKFFKENCIEDEEKITCPTVYDELTTERIFTMSFVDGYTISHKDRIVADGYDPVEIGHAIAENFVHQVLDVGWFHADPHQGNIMLSHGKPYWIDFGMIGHVTDKDIDTIQNIILSLLSADAEEVVNGIMALGASSAKTNRDKLVEDAQMFLDKYSGTKGISDIDMTTLIDEITDLASKHHITLPGQFTMLGRSILAIEGVIEQLCPELDLFKLLSDKMIERNKKDFDIKEIALNFGKELLSTGKKVFKIPGLTADSLQMLAKGKMKMNMELTGIDEPLEKIGQFVKYIVLALLACILFIGSCILASVDLQPKTSNGMPLISIGGIIFAIALAIYSVGKMSKKK
ncbi:MAG: AarF/ABC1/UbiB kinase family protein [Ruminococcus sp.]|nr:AarF/ABC1/UbiB kinase family protein [Ruminococcus sp.]